MPRAIDEPRAQPVTADDFAYLRLIGNHAECIDYRSITVDRMTDLVRWAELALDFRRGREARGVYILLNNHYSGSSPATIRELERLLGLDVEPFGSPDLGHDLAPSDVAGRRVDPARQGSPPPGQARLPGF